MTERIEGLVRTIELVEWRVGLMTVPLMQAVRTYAGRSLPEVKAHVERLLDGETVVLQFATDPQRDAFRKIVRNCAPSLNSALD